MMLLRHSAIYEGLQIDRAGRTSIVSLAQAMNWESPFLGLKPIILHIATWSNAKRFMLWSEQPGGFPQYISCSSGHTFHIEFPESEDQVLPRTVTHATTFDKLWMIHSSGVLKPMARDLHAADTRWISKCKVVGSRQDSDVVIVFDRRRLQAAVDRGEIRFRISDAGVVLFQDAVPVQYAESIEYSRRRGHHTLE